jgi:hypothetical protein
MTTSGSEVRWITVTDGWAASWREPVSDDGVGADTARVVTVAVSGGANRRRPPSVSTERDTEGDGDGGLTVEAMFCKKNGGWRVVNDASKSGAMVDRGAWVTKGMGAAWGHSGAAAAEVV